MAKGDPRTVHSVKISLIQTLKSYEVYEKPASQAEKGERAAQLLNRAIEAKLFKVGLVFQCSRCHRRNWYATTDFTDMWFSFEPEPGFLPRFVNARAFSGTNLSWAKSTRRRPSSHLSLPRGAMGTKSHPHAPAGARSGYGGWASLTGCRVHSPQRRSWNKGRVRIKAE
jgi:hypothetical protein